MLTLEIANMENPRKSAAATEIKNRFGDYLGEVVRLRRPLLIEKRGRPVAVIVDFERWQTMREEPSEKAVHPWVAACRQLGEDIKRENPRLKPFSSAAMIRQLREEES